MTKVVNAIFQVQLFMCGSHVLAKASTAVSCISSIYKKLPYASSYAGNSMKKSP